MSKRPRTEPPTGQEDIWGDDFTYDEVNSIVNIETLASQSNFPVQSNDQMCLNSNGSQKENQTREGEIKILKLKIKQLEIQLSKTNQEKDDKFRNMKKVIDCKDTELKFQKQELTALKNKIKEININVSKIVPQKNVSFSCMKTGSNSKLLHDASEHNNKKNISTQTITNEQNLIIKDNFKEINTTYDKLKKCLYPDLFNGQCKKKDIKQLSTIQECHLILAKLIVLENYDENQSYSLIKLLFQNCQHILKSTIEALEEPIDDTDFVKREKQLIYSYLNLNEQYSKSSSLVFDQQFSYLLECISVLTTISNIVSKIVMDHTDNIFQTFAHFVQIIGSQSRTLEYVFVIKALIKFLSNVCNCNTNRDMSKQKQLDIFNIIKEIVFCRPCIDIVQELIHFFSKIAIYTEITDCLCQLSCPKSFILSDCISTFTTGTCVLRVLCLQLELLKHNNQIIINYLYFVHTLLNSTHIPKWMHKIANRTCECTSSFVELTIYFLYIVFNIYEKDKELFDIDNLKLLKEIIENSSSILYRLGKIDEEFRSHISKCKGRYDVIVEKISKLEFGRSNKFLVKELKKFEFKSITSSQYNSSMVYEIFPIDIPKFKGTSQYQFDEHNKQLSEEI